ncbi:MAG: hypothetical protein ACFUZC_22205 [Chthoniobacteraceae bacterium]
MTSPKPLVLLFALAFAVPGKAGDKTAVEPTPTEPQPGSWTFKLASPIWLASAWGTTGLGGKDAHVDMSAATILKHVTFTTSLSAEARKDRLGIYADYLYLGDQAGVYTSGLVSKMDLKFTETIADLDASWRVIETPRGWVDLLAGVRYMNIYSRLQLHPNDGNIDSTSARLVDTALADVERTLDKALKGVLDGKDPTLPVPPLSGSLEQKIVDAVRAAKQDPELAAAIASGIRERIAAAKARVAGNIAQILRRNLSRAFSLNQDWLDPYLGLRARYNLTPALYLTAKADVGGFSVGSRVSVEAIAAIGYQMTRSISAEAGYKYLYVDYHHDSFVYNISNGGALVTIGINF